HNNSVGQISVTILAVAGSNLSGNQHCTGKKTDLAGMARAAGCDNVVIVQDVDTGPALQAAIEGGQATVLVVKCDSGNAKMTVITMDPVIIRDRFMKAVAS
ncbi:sulfopyruvate decarboxylase subunit beta, partial [Ruegeria sp. WL0004]|nr:sulfopyruvate decarboxylase subunit beta [Ruegeria sp. WL0004]